MNGNPLASIRIFFLSSLCLTLSALSVLVCGSGQAAAIDVPLTVKENAAVGASGYPVSVVVPLRQSYCTDPSALGIKGVPSQVEALERWPGDNSLRHVLVHFQPTVGKSGKAIYHLTRAGQRLPEKRVTVTQSDGAMTVTTGPLKFTVSKTQFNILDRVWLDTNADGVYQDSEILIESNAQNGGVFSPRNGAGVTQFDTARNDLQVTVEESGPMRAVIRAEAPAKFTAAENHLHGFAVRIYAYAGRPFVKIDYQLQNSARNVVRSWPLYFEAMNLDFRLKLAAGQTSRYGLGTGGAYTIALGGGSFLAQETHNRFRIRTLQDNAIVYDSGILPNGEGPEGFIDVSDTTRGVAAVVRNFWQTWPNGLEVDGQSKLSLQLFPHWSAQWHDGGFSPSGLYWLEDMQHFYKEMLLYFHGPNATDGELLKLARTFQLPPTAMVPTDWYRKTHATLDLGGIIPPPRTIPKAANRRKPFYHTDGFDTNDWYNATGPFYGAGWINFYDPEPGYRATACMHGGWPYSAAHCIATGNPADYFEGEAHGQSELNLRPEWMAQYHHKNDWKRLQLTENPYCGGRWRIFEGNGISKLAVPPLAQTGGEEPLYYTRDDQHGWFYHVAEAYFITGNPWIRDWYRFIGEFRRVRLDRLDPFPDTSSRATGHSLNQVLQAYRVTGDSKLLVRFRDHIRKYLRPEQDLRYGDQLKSVEPEGGGFQTGYLVRCLVDYLEEVRAKGDRQAYAEGFNYLSGFMEWNYNYGNFPYYFDARGGGKGVSSGTALTLADPQAWYYWHTGKQKFLDQLNAYMTAGINGGEKPYGEFSKWTGQFEGRYYLFVKNTTRSPATPPAAITNLKASIPTASTLKLEWTCPARAARYHVVWSGKPIVADQSIDPAVSNWWAARAVGPTLTPAAGKKQRLSIRIGSLKKVYAAIFSFDRADNMSVMSNVAEASTP